MKTPILLLAIVSLLGLASPGCKKAEDDLTKGFSPEIQRIVPKEVIDTMRKYGMVIHQGRKPPKTEGIYLFSENILVGSSQRGDTKGRKYADYRYRFYEQDDKALTIKVSAKGYGSTGNVTGEATGKGAFLAGADNKFTIFSEDVGTSQNATYVTLATYSGEITSDGIKGFRYAFYMKSKQDPGNVLVPVGTTRVFEDKDGTSKTVSSLRMSIEEALRNPGPDFPSGVSVK